jgi:hypothetical protein
MFSVRDSLAVSESVVFAPEPVGVAFALPRPEVPMLDLTGVSKPVFSGTRSSKARWCCWCAK